MDQIAKVFEKCSRRALQAVFFARMFAGENGADLIDTEDLLYGLFRGAPEAFPTLSKAALMRQLQELRPVKAPPVPSSQDLGITDDLRRSLEIAMQRAEEQGCKEIRTEHFLLALVQVQTGHAAAILVRAGLIEAELLHNVSQIDCDTMQAEPIAPDDAQWEDL